MSVDMDDYLTTGLDHRPVFFQKYWYVCHAWHTLWEYVK